MKRDISLTEKDAIDAVVQAAQAPGLDSMTRMHLGFTADALNVLYSEAQVAHAYYIAAVRGIEERKAREAAAFMASVDSTVQSVKALEGGAS